MPLTSYGHLRQSEIPPKKNVCILTFPTSAFSAKFKINYRNLLIRNELASVFSGDPPAPPKNPEVFRHFKLPLIF